ncbi:MAG TPA: ABC transporter permease [Blastocatellia bacterium]|nr:ABC transporter permease [Blastocatellia bacterium]
MDNLVLSSLFYRKTRTFTTIAGVALGVVLVVLTVGIVHGFLNDQGRRNSAITAELIFSAPGNTFGFSLSPTLSLKISDLEQIREIPGVKHVAPLGQYLRGRMIDGVDFDSYRQVSGVKVVDGRPIVSGDEAIVDRFHATRNKVKVGDSIDVLERKFKVVGIYEPESLGRIKIPLSTLQDYLKRKDLCSAALIKLDDPSQAVEIATRIKERFPDNGLLLTRDLPVLYARGTPALQTFLNVVVVVAAIISSLVVLLTMYTTVTERTRQIGILKSLGASRAWIAAEIEKEALLISSMGVLVGFVLAIAGKFVITRLTPMTVELEPRWLFYALGMGIVTGLLGALYPALRAANEDPVTALAYE